VIGRAAAGAGSAAVPAGWRHIETEHAVLLRMQRYAQAPPVRQNRRRPLR
jgi:hypothetical protein